jgi:hypothetical protein
MGPFSECRTVVEDPSQGELSMSIRLTSLVAVSLVFAPLVAFAAEGHHAAAPATSGFERFKELAGEWVGKTDKSEHGMGKMRTVFKVTSGGSAVAETMAPGTAHEMINMIHPDGDDIVLTHYCAIGNQPEMKAPGKIEGKDVVFTFSRCGNMKSPNDMHMHAVTYTFVDKDTLRTKWTNYDNGKPAGDMVFEYQRKK